MDNVTADCGALCEAVVFLNHFKNLRDHRQRGKVVYPLGEVLLLTLLAVLAGADSFVDIARFGCKKLEFLRRFRPFLGGTPSHDHLGDIFAALDADQFQRCFPDHVGAVVGNCVVAGQRQAITEDIPEIRRCCKCLGQNPFKWILPDA